MPTRETLLERAQTATRDSKFVAFHDGLDWEALVRDVAAMANTGGGVVVVDAAVDADSVEDQVFHFTRQNFTGITVEPLSRDGRSASAILVEPATEEPLIFEGGTIFFRHGARTEPARPEDVRRFIDRRVRAIRGAWVRGLRSVMQAPPGTEVRYVKPDPRGDPAKIQLTTDPRAPVYGRLDPDQTHPYRQKELIHALNERIPEDAHINQHTMLSVRRVHGIDETTRPDFVHRTKFAGSPQYSRAFLEWLVEQYGRDARFFEKAKARYQAEFRRRDARSQA